MITQSKTFCTAPWTSLNIDQTGRVFPCMHSGYELGNIKEKPIQQILVDQPLKSLKSAMAQGEWHEACTWCKRLEDTTGSSGRTVRELSPQSAAAIDADIDWFGLEHIVVNWSNLCNLTCVYCNPETSTAWQSVKKIPINHIKNEHQDLIELAKTHGHTIRGLSLGGGEPLLQKGLLEFLQHLDRNRVSAMVTTNLSVDISTNPIYQELKQWKNIRWMISFDNADRDKFEYVRRGADWDQFTANIAQLKQDKQFVWAHPAYSIYCALDLVEYYDFCNQHQLDIFWCELNHPWELDIRRQPARVRLEAVEEIDRCVAKYSQRPELSTDALLRYRRTLLDTSYLENVKYRADTLQWHTDIEQELGLPKRFVDLWPKLAELMA
jgi:radical SAM protein with 4Fe4S-binding SPASM domain